jgi:hypothetical protein
MDNLVSILKIPVLNMDVKNSILKHIQNWSFAFERKPTLAYVGQVYKTLKNEGSLTPAFSYGHSLTLAPRVQVSASGYRSCQFRHGRVISTSRMDRF